MTLDQTQVLLNAQRQLMEADEVLASVIKLLDEQGYNHFISGLDQGKAYSFQKRIDDGLNHLCECNDKLFMNVKVYSFSVHHSVEMCMCHENSDNQWFELKVYGIRSEEFVKYYQTGFDKLFKAWKTIY